MVQGPPHTHQYWWGTSSCTCCCPDPPQPAPPPEPGVFDRIVNWFRQPAEREPE